MVCGPRVEIPPGAPQLSHVSQSRHKWREGHALVTIAKRRLRPPKGTTFRFTVNEPARVTLSFTQRPSGRRSGGKCVAKTRHNASRPRCHRTVTRATLTLSAHAGRDRVRFQGRISRKRKLNPGTYTVVIIATNAVGERSGPHRLTFTIVPG